MPENTHSVRLSSHIPWKSLWNKRGRHAVPALFTATLALLAAGCAPKPTPKEQLNNLVGRCVQAMVSNTCRVMQSAGQSLAQPGVETIFVAGIGPIDAKLYTSLRESGEAMCDNVRRACEQAWQGNACTTAQALYPELAKK